MVGAGDIEELLLGESYKSGPAGKEKKEGERESIKFV